MCVAFGEGRELERGVGEVDAFACTQLLALDDRRRGLECNAIGADIDAVFFCPHTADDGCECRKPLPGLFSQIGERYGVDLNETAGTLTNSAGTIAVAGTGIGPLRTRPSCS